MEGDVCYETAYVALRRSSCSPAGHSKAQQMEEAEYLGIRSAQTIKVISTNRQFLMMETVLLGSF